MDLSIIIVSWNIKDKLRANLVALFKSVGDSSFEIYVVDNNSADGTAAMVAADFPQVKLIANETNAGFAKANNQAWRQAQGDFVLLLNPDMLVLPDTIKNLISWLKNNPQAWVTGGHLVDEAGKTIPHVRRFPTLADQLAVAAKLPHLWPKVLDKYLCRDFDYTQAAKVDSIRGSFFAVRRSAWATIGLLDERFFVWFEEVDYCKRVYEAGGEVWYAPDAVCVDYVGQSFKTFPRPYAQKLMRESQLKYFAKWHGVWQVCLLQIAWFFGGLIVSLALLLKIKAKNRT